MKKLKLTPFQQAVLFQYICEKGLPPWAKGDSVTAFARLMNLTETAARELYERSVACGYLDRA